MKGDQSIIMNVIPSEPRKGSLSSGLLMVPKVTQLIPATNKHKRVGSTGTTGDESGTTDDEDADAADSSGCSLFNNGDLSSFSDIATITDKVGHMAVMHRNSSDSSVYSDLGLDHDDGLYAAKGTGKCAGDGGDAEWDGMDLVEIKEQAFANLRSQLDVAHQELRLRDEEVTRLSRIRQDVESELEDLTASLFQEAHNMVREANEKQAAAEKGMKEAQMKVEVLTAEVAALKTLVLTSTPSMPNPHLHPQIDTRTARDEAGVAIFAKKHRRSPSHFNLKYGREHSPPSSPIKEVYHIASEVELKEGLEVDPNVHKEFLSWRQKPAFDKTDPFLKRIYSEDIDLCLAFNNRELSKKVADAVENGTILIEAVSDKTKAMFPKKCALLEVPRLCFYRMNMGGGQDNWQSISQICRNRIIAVCDFLNYLKYIERGLVKSTAHDVYWEIVRLRKNMVLARLGLELNT